jgi:hypothetical protein
MGVVRRRRNHPADDRRHWDDPRPEGRRRGYGLLAALGTAALVCLGLLILAVRFFNLLRVLFGVDVGPFLTNLGEPPTLAAPVVLQGYDLAEPHDPLELVIRQLGPGYAIPLDDWATAQFRTDPAVAAPGTGEPGIMTLTQFSGQQPGDEVSVYQWYQWGTGQTRLFYATYRDRHNNERVFAKVLDFATEGGLHFKKSRYPYRRVDGGRSVVIMRDPP